MTGSAPLTDPEAAAVMVLLRLPEWQEDGYRGREKAERLLQQLIAQAIEARKERFTEALQNALSKHFSPEAVQAGQQALEKLGIELLSQDDVEARRYLSAHGHWNCRFGERQKESQSPLTYTVQAPSGQKRAVSDPQKRIVEVFRSEMNESMHVQGYAGSGKTHLIHTLVEHLNPSSTLLLAMSGAQLEGLKKRLNHSRLVCRTFAALAKWVLAYNPTLNRHRWQHRTRANFQVPDDIVAQRLGFHAPKGMHPAQGAMLARRTLMSYCYSEHEHIGFEHVPSNVQMSPTDRSVVVRQTKTLWREMFTPSQPDIELPLRGYHLIKYLALTQDVIPPSVTHVIVDESHELSAPVLQLLDRSPQAVITLGDEYQRLQGGAPQSKPWIRQREVNASLRTGRGIESIINPIIEAHPGRTKTPFQGAGAHQTKVHRFDKPFIPEQPTTILVENEWHLFEWFQRLTQARARFTLLNGCAYQFEQFVRDCLGLFHDGVRPRHPFLFQYDSWDRLARAQQRNSSFIRIQQMLERGYGYADFEQSLAQQSTHAQRAHWLGRVQDAKNQEFERVMLTPQLLNKDVTGGREAAAAALSQVYTAATRERYELFVPGHLMDWLSSYR